MKKFIIPDFFEYHTYLELLSDIVYSMKNIDDEIVYSFDEYLPPQYLQDMLKYNEHYPIIVDKYNYMWKVVNDRDGLKDIFMSDFLVEIRIIESSNINEWKYCIQVIEDIEDTYLEITANQDKEIQEIEIERILENYQ